MSIIKASGGQIKPPGKKKQKRPPKKITPDYLHNAGLYYLQRFAASSGHFRAVMMRKVKRSCLHHKDQDFEACAVMVDALVEKFKKAGLLDDKAYTGAVVNSSRRRGLSRKAIIARLAARGIESDNAAGVLADYDSEHYGGTSEADRIAALAYARKRKLGPFAAGETEKEKSLAALGRRGFSYDTACYVLEIEKEEAEEILSGRSSL